MKLKEYRKKKGLTQEEVANHLNIPTRTYQNYEREVRKPCIDLLCTLASLYDITLDELVGRIESVDNIHSQHGQVIIFEETFAELNSCFFNMSDKAREALMVMAHCLENVSPKDK